MYVRVASVKAGPEGLDKAVETFEQKVVPGARSQSGYQGAVLILDRETGEASGITMWESLEALNASERFTVEARTQVVESGVAHILDVDRYETVIQEMTGEATTPSYVRNNEVYVQPEKIDELVAFMRGRAPSITSQKGCRALVVQVNRMTGRCILRSVWQTAEDREASEAGVSGVRKEVADLAGHEPTVKLGEAAFIEILQPVRPS